MTIGQAGPEIQKWVAHVRTRVCKPHMACLNLLDNDSLSIIASLGIIDQAVLQIKKWGAHVRTSGFDPTYDLPKFAPNDRKSYAKFDRSWPSRCSIKASEHFVTLLSIARATCYSMMHIGRYWLS